MGEQADLYSAQEEVHTAFLYPHSLLHTSKFPRFPMLVHKGNSMLLWHQFTTNTNTCLLATHWYIAAWIPTWTCCALIGLQQALSPFHTMVCTKQCKVCLSWTWTLTSAWRVTRATTHTKQSNDCELWRLYLCAKFLRHYSCFLKISIVLYGFLNIDYWGNPNSLLNNLQLW